MVVGDDCNPISNLGLADALNVRLHQCATNLLALVVWQHCQRMKSNGAAPFFVANSLPILKGPALALPVGG